MNDIVIEIIVRDADNEIIAKRTAHSFESAEESIGKLENFTKQYFRDES